jgi:hypothetical protein
MSKAMEDIAREIAAAELTSSSITDAAGCICYGIIIFGRYGGG